MTAKQTIEAGKAILGIEFGSTRIKAVLIDEDNKPIWSLDLLYRGYLVRPAGLLCRAPQGCSGSVRLRNRGTRCHRLLCHDARLHGFQQG